MAIRLVILLLMVLPWIGNTATYWNAWTTNFPGTPVKGNNNLSITNASGSEWRFYGSAAETVARLSDISGGGFITNAAAGPGIDVALVGGTIWITNLWSTNGFVDIRVTNGLATIAYVNTATNGFVDASITNGLATISYVNTATNGFVGSSITNGLAGLSYVVSATQNLASVVQPASVNLTNWSGTSTSALASYYLASNPSGYISGIGTTNQPASANLTNWSNTATSTLASYYLASNPSGYISGIGTSNQPASANLTNWSTVSTNAYVTATNGTAVSLTANGLTVPSGFGVTLADIPSAVLITDSGGAITGNALNPNQFALVTSTISLTNTVKLTNANLFELTTIRGGTNTGGFTNGGPLVPIQATASRALVTDSNRVLTNSVVTATELALLSGQTTLAYQPTNGTLTQWGTVATNAYVSSTNGSTRGLTIANASVSTVAIYDANGVLTNGAVSSTELALLDGQTSLAYQPTNNVLTQLAANSGNTVTNISGTGEVIASTATGTLTVNAGTMWNGCSGNFLVANTTCFWPLNNTKTNLNASSVSGGTRTLFARQLTLTNLYVVMSGVVGNNNSNHFGIFTNGVATTIAVMISGAAAVSGNDTTHSAVVPVGVEAEVKLISSASATARAVAWGIEGR